MHSSLGNKSETPSQKNKKKKRTANVIKISPADYASKGKFEAENKVSSKKMKSINQEKTKKLRKKN